MKNTNLILIDKIAGIVLIPTGMVLNFIFKLIRKVFRSEAKGILIIKLLGAGNFIPMSSQINHYSSEIITVKSNYSTLILFNIGKHIHIIDDKNIITLLLSSLKISILMLFKNYKKVINLEMESTFAKFLSLISSPETLSGLSSHNKSFFDSLIYDNYLVSPIIMNRQDLLAQLIKFRPMKNVYISEIIKSKQLAFNKKFIPFDPNSNVAIFPSCSSTDNLRRLKFQHWKTILKNLIDNNKVAKIAVVFSSEKDIQFIDFHKFLINLDQNKISLKITNYMEFVEEVKKSDLVVSVDSQALHIAQFFKKRVVAFYGPTSPFSINLESTTYPITNSLSCSPCTHKYQVLPCGSLAPCLNFKKTDFGIFND